MEQNTHIAFVHTELNLTIISRLHCVSEVIYLGRKGKGRKHRPAVGL